MSSEYTDWQLEEGIKNALRAQNMEAVVDILKVLIAQNPDRGLEVYKTIQCGIRIGKSKHP